jgi:hypothetical protein
MGEAGVVQRQKPDGVAVVPKMFHRIVDRFAAVAKTLSGDDKK